MGASKTGPTALELAERKNALLKLALKKLRVRAWRVRPNGEAIICKLPSLNRKFGNDIVIEEKSCCHETLGVQVLES